MKHETRFLEEALRNAEAVTPAIYEVYPKARARDVPLVLVQPYNVLNPRQANPTGLGYFGELTRVIRERDSIIVFDQEELWEDTYRKIVDDLQAGAGLAFIKMTIDDDHGDDWPDIVEYLQRYGKTLDFAGVGFSEHDFRPAGEVGGRMDALRSYFNCRPLRQAISLEFRRF